MMENHPGPQQTHSKSYRGNNLLNSLIFVVRYFGGVKLGAGGLVRAYSQSARLVIQEAEIIEFLETETIES